jgi:methionyl-tRNA formyltransferase
MTAKKRFKILFMGSPDFAVPPLRAICERSAHEVVAVVTQPDRRRGRGRRLAPPAVKVAAQELGLRVQQPEKIRRRAVREELAAFGADLFVVAAYGKILRPRMLAVPALGCVNVHASLLPALRGAAPIQWAVINGEARSGISIMQMDEGMDTGPVYLQRGFELRPDETAGSLHDRLAPLGAELLLEALDGLAAGTLEATPQPEEGVTMAPMLSKEDGLIDFSGAAVEVDRRIRGLDPWPCGYVLHRGDRVRLFASSVARAEQGAVGKPGEVLGSDARGLLVACGEGAVMIGELQLPGRRRLPAPAVLAGWQLPRGEVLGAR